MLNKDKNSYIEDLDYIPKEEINDYMELIDEIKSIPAPEPTREMTLRVVNLLDQYMEEGETSYFTQILMVARGQVRLLDTGYLLSTLGLLILGFILSQYQASGVLESFIYGAPILMVIGLAYGYRGVLNKTYEMELACKFSRHEMLVSRFLIITGYTVILCIINSIFVSNHYSIGIGTLVMAWLTPLLLMGSLYLYLLLKLGSIQGTVASMFLWGLYCKLSYPIVVDIQRAVIIRWSIVQGAMIVLSLLLFIIVLKNIKKGELPKFYGI